MKLFKCREIANTYGRQLIGEEPTTETFYVDESGKKWGVPYEYWGPQEIDVPDEKIVGKSWDEL